METTFIAAPHDQLELPKKVGPVDVWFDDGNLLVVVGECRFRVYAGIISTSSTIFRAMLHASKRSDMEHVEDCAVVRLTGDSAEDVSFLLRAMHDMEFFLPPPVQAPFAVIAGILRTSTKYDVPILLQRSLLHLSSVYATSLDGFDTSQGFLTPSIHDHFGAIKLAREFDIQWIRPAAMYLCMSLPFSQTYGVFKAANLSPEDQMLCLLAIDPLKSAKFMRYKFLTDFVKCSTKPSDAVARHGILESKMAEEGSHVLSKSFQGSVDVCSACLNSMKVALKGSRPKAWESIPGIFQCQPWGELAQICRSRCGV